MCILNLITSANDLVTPREQTRAGFISFALEKNKNASPLVKDARDLRVMASVAKTPADLATVTEIRDALLTAAGLSDKSLQYLTEEDKTESIDNLIKNFLEPAGEYFLDALVYRYLLVRGDSLGGSIRNRIGELAQQKLIRTIISNLTTMNIGFEWYEKDSRQWKEGTSFEGKEGCIKALYWHYGSNDRLLAFNLTVPLVNKNVDICLFDGTPDSYNRGKIVHQKDRFIMLGELKGGIDPAGADEHWKTGNTALGRIRTAFRDANHPVKTSFIAAAIESAMAEEIFGQLNNGILSNAANMTIENQLADYCNWIITL